MNSERTEILERLDEESNRADKLAEERDCAREALREAEETIVTLKAEVERINRFRERQRMKVNGLRELVSALDGQLRLAREQLRVPAPKTEPPGSVSTPGGCLDGGPGHQNASCGHGDPKKGHS